MVAANFAALLTVDQNLEFQQNMIEAHVAALDRLGPGELIRIGG